MDFTIKPRYFVVGTKSKKTTLSISKNANEALEKLSEMQGMTVPELVTEVLEIYLCEMAKQGHIKIPDKVDKAA